MPVPGQPRSGGNGGGGADDELTWADLLTRPISDDPFLTRNNFGLSNYGPWDVDRQLDYFEKGMFSENAFSRLLFKRAIYDAKCALAAAEWEAKADEAGADRFETPAGAVVATDGGTATVERLTRNQYIKRNAERCWSEIDTREGEKVTDAQLRALEDHAGVKSPWVSPFHRMMLALNEVLRSKGAHTIDALSGRVKEVRKDGGDMQEQIGPE